MLYLEEALLEDCKQADHLFAADMSYLVFVAQFLSAARQNSCDFGRRRSGHDFDRRHSSHDFGRRRSILGEERRKPGVLHL